MAARTLQAHIIKPIEPHCGNVLMHIAGVWGRHVAMRDSLLLVVELRACRFILQRQNVPTPVKVLLQR